MPKENLGEKDPTPGIETPSTPSIPREGPSTMILFDKTTQLSSKEKTALEAKIVETLDRIETHETEETPETLKAKIRENIQCVARNRETQEQIQKEIRETHRKKTQTDEMETQRAELEARKKEAEAIEGTLKSEKTELLKNALSLHLKTHRKTLQNLLTNLFKKIELERKRQGDPPYSNDALLMLVYEVVYGHWLWDGKGRKDGSGAYFETHLMAAAEEHVRHGFTSLARILSALKHDDFEDLEIHHLDFDTAKTTIVNGDWVFCDDLYEPELEGTLSNGRSSKEYLVELKPKIIKTIRAVTKPDTEEKPKDALTQKLQDEAALIRFFENLLEEGHAGPLKILEQVHNMRTLGGLRPERRMVKGASILKHWGTLAQVLELAQAHHTFVEKGMELYCPGVKTRYHELQRQRIAARLRLRETEDVSKPEDPGSKFWRILGGAHWGAIKSEAEENLQGDLVTRTRRIQRQRFRQLGHRPEKGTGIVKIEIRPTPIEQHINIQQLLREREAFQLQITPEDPLFEVRILTRNPEQTASIVGELTRRASQEGIGTKTSHTKDGTILFLACEEGEIRIQLQTEAQEAKAKRGQSEKRERGNRTNAIPETLRSRIREALRIAKDHGRPILEVVDETVLTQTMEVVAWNGARRERVALPMGSTPRDLAAHLPQKIAEHLLLDQKAQAEITRFTSTGGYSTPLVVPMDASLQPGDLCRIQIQGASVSEIDPGTLAFCQTPEVRSVLRRHLSGRAIEAGQTHLLGLAHLFRIESSALATLCLHRTHNASLGQPFAQDPENRLRELQVLKRTPSDLEGGKALAEEEKHLEEELARKIPIDLTTNSRRKEALVARYSEKRKNLNRKIGLGEIDPLQALAPYLERKPGIKIQILVEDRPGMLIQILGQWITPKGNINIDTNETQKNADGTQWVEITLGEIPEGIDNHQLLKMILHLKYIEGVRNVEASTATEKLFKFPDYLTRLLDTAKSLEEQQAAA